MDGTIFFVDVPNSTAFNLWRIDGTGPAVKVRHFDGLTAPDRMWKVGHKLFFFVNSELWSSDGTGGGTALVKSGVPRTFCFDADQYAVLNDIFYWSAGQAVWRSDGTAAGTYALMKFESGRVSVPDCMPIVAAGKWLYFAGADPTFGVEPWISDGTPSGTHMVADIAPGEASSLPGQFLPVGDLLFFTASDVLHGRELWAINNGPLPPRRRAARK